MAHRDDDDEILVSNREMRERERVRGMKNEGIFFSIFLLSLSFAEKREREIIINAREHLFLLIDNKYFLS